jgi:glycosyltransferase involved in cell wall biosynthesis
MVSFTHGEGFGRPLLEATMADLPVIASGWSGQLDFLDNKKSMLLPGEMTEIPKNIVWDKILIKGSKWFVVDENAAYKALNFVFKDSYDFLRKAKSLGDINRNKFSLEGMCEDMGKLIDKYVPTSVNLNLPKLKKISKSDNDTIKLPKLKRV